MTFNRTFKALLSNAPLRDETELVSADPSTNVMIETVTATKATVFKREYNNLVELMGENGEAILAELFEKKGVSNASMEDKFEVMKSFAKKWSNELHKETLEAGGGKSFSEIQAKYDNSYKAAYGVENDIMKRVNDYNTSQQIGGQVVKAGAVMAASMVAACSGMGLVGVAGVTSGATIVSEVVDRGTSGKALNTLKEEGFTAYVKTVNDDIDWEATLKQAVISGGSVLIGGAVAKGVNFVMQGQTPIAQAVAMFGADVLTDASLEYVTTGTITIEGVMFAVALSAVGNIVAYKQLSAAADVANSVDEAFDGARGQMTSQPDASNPPKDLATKLADAKGLDGKPLFKQKDIDLILQGMANLDGKPIPNFEAKVEAVLKNFAEVDHIANSKNKAATLWHAISDPTQSTIDLNPAAFGAKPKATSAMASTSGTTSNTPDFKTRLMTAESPTDFDPASLQQWADDMGLHLTIEEGSSRTAIFRDDSDNIIRRITEDYRSKGTVYDDRISYYENGRHTAGRLKYNFEPFAKTYEVSLDGEAINIQRITLKTPENVTKVAASDVEGLLSRASGYVDDVDIPASAKPKATTVAPDVEGLKVDDFGSKAFAAKTVEELDQIYKEFLPLMDDELKKTVKSLYPNFVENIEKQIHRSSVEFKTKLANAGFTEDIIRNLKAQDGDAFVNEILDMVEYLEDQVSAGKPITKELIESASNKFFSSGNAQKAQLSRLTETWNRGNTIHKAYGQSIPASAKPKATTAAPDVEGLKVDDFGSKAFTAKTVEELDQIYKEFLPLMDDELKKTVKSLYPNFVENIEKQIHRSSVEFKTKLANAGFTEDIIRNLKAQDGDAFVNEILDMVEYLEDQVSAGKPITKELIESASNKFFSSGNAQKAQLSRLTETWNRGNTIHKAYGQSIPASARSKTTANSVNEFFNRDISPILEPEFNSAAPSSNACENIGQVVENLENIASKKLKSAVSNQIIKKDGKEFEVIKDLTTGKIISEEPTIYTRISVQETITADNGMVIETHKINGEVVSKTITNPSKTQSILIDYNDGKPREYCVRYFKNFNDRASYLSRYDELGRLFEEQIRTNGIETRRYMGEAGTVGRIDNADGSTQYYEISNCTNFNRRTVNYDPWNFNVEIWGKKPTESLFYTYPFRD